MNLLENSVRRSLAAADVIQGPETFTPLNGGRTNRVWKINRKTPLICKLYSTHMQNPLYENAPSLEYKCLKQMESKKLAPKPVTYLETIDGQILIYEYLDGKSWTNDVVSVAKLLAEIHAQPIPHGLRLLPSGTKALTRQTLDIIGTLPKAKAAELIALQPDSPGCENTPLCLVHTDVVPGNIIKTDQGLRLIDWQCPGVGDPVEDLAMFLSPAMHYIYRGTPLTIAEAAEFLHAYPDETVRNRYQVLARLYHWRMIAYCAWKAAQGDKDYARAGALEATVLKQ